ncbi:MAG: IS630 family transposase [Cypionkella sp.]|nr:IS630 family transposase [Cypionkella sp.]
MAGIAITRRELTATELRAAAGKTKDSRATRRMLAIALVVEGVDRATAAQTCGMDRQTLRDWVHRYNAEGVAGLVNRTVPHRPRRLAPEQMAALATWVEAGPDPVRDGVVRWRRRDLQHRIKPEFGVVLHERSVGKQLAALGFRRLSVRPQHPKSDPEAQDAFQKNFPEAVAAAIPARARDKPLEIWFQDEARVGQQGTLTRIWARRGTRPRAPRDTRYQWAYLFGAVCPARGTAAGLVLPFVNTAAMNAHLAEIARTVAPGAHALLILDGAGWHGSNALVVPDNLSLLTLPPYSPELNPVENVWAYLRTNKLAISVFNTYEEIVDACCKAWNFFANDPVAIASITSRTWAQVS